MAATPSQTVGPYFRIQLAREERRVVVADGPMHVEGRRGRARPAPQSPPTVPPRPLRVSS